MLYKNSLYEKLLSRINESQLLQLNSMVSTNCWYMIPWNETAKVPVYCGVVPPNTRY